MAHPSDNLSLPLEELLDTVPTQIWTMADDRTYGYANAAHAAFLGKTRAEIEHRDIGSILSAPLADVCTRYNREAFKSGQSSSREVWAQNAGGALRLLRVIRSPKLDSAGNVLFLTCSAEDITQQKLLSEQTLAREHILSAIARFSHELFSDSPDAVEKGLSTLGMEVQADRVYYWENHRDESSGAWVTSQKFEWCAEGIPSEIGNQLLQNVPLEPYSYILAPLKEQKPFVALIRDIPDADLRGILETQQVQSLLVIPLYISGEFYGFVGFDSCRHERVWTDDEIKLLELFIELLSKSIQKNQLQREAEQSRKNFDKFFNTIDDLLCIFDLNANFLHVNETVLRKTGYTKEELIGQNVLFLHPPERAEEAKTALAQMIAGTEHVCRVPVLRKDGVQFPAETHVSLGEWNGQPAFFGITQDTTLLEFSVEKFSKAFHDSLLLKAIVNIENGTHIEVNDALCKTLGYTREEIIGKTPFELGLFATKDDEDAIVRAFTEKTSLQNVELTIRSKDRSRRSVVMNATPIHIGTMTCVIVSMLDITERKQMERELRRYNENLEDLVQEKVQELADALWGTINSLVRLAETRDDDTGGHLKRLGDSCRVVATVLSFNSVYSEQLTYDFIYNLQQASMLHDIGKVGIPDSILLKPGKLTREEFEQMKQHTTIGAETLRQAYPHFQNNGILNMAIDITSYHHERWDGKGYPKGLKGNEIPLSAQIVAICDVYDALRSRRSYKPAFSHEESLAEIRRECGSHFNPAICDAFFHCADEIYHIYEAYVF
ncbi:MAG: PAS domain S-box protein [Clostridiales bacterium]|nr:PAS domain S-box protein [Clostridiales bacterium]